MPHMKSTFIVSALAVLTLSACSAPDGTPRENTNTGAAIGAGLGAIAGLLVGDDKESIVKGALIGGAIGGIAGYSLDKQEERLRSDLADSGISIQNTGSELILTLPEALTFETDSTYVRPSLQDDLAKLAVSLLEFPESTVDIIGHTDNVGDEPYNQKLSARRAQSVGSILVNNGVPDSRIIAFGRGEMEPVSSNDTAEGRANNRRVEVVIRPSDNI